MLGFPCTYCAWVATVSSTCYEFPYLAYLLRVRKYENGRFSGRKTIVPAAETVVSAAETAVSAAETVVSAAETIGSAAGTVVSAAESSPGPKRPFRRPKGYENERVRKTV